ncbi:OmpH family outer membrane protein [Nonlabens xiamenensis]|uniref:OmpH family outer membrane protein n=1 Tax=Nonlabens xiamenensis TaxID=2341043 RepID=UPI000F6155D5|nr:OmpH family outer membrane protein [Nonlabens xiamenensis]
MKQVKTLLAIVAFVFAGINLANAQATPTKICHVASQELVESLPKAIAADKQLKNLAKTYETKLMAMDKELKTKYTNAQEAAPNKTQEENERVLAELGEGQKKLEEYYQQSQKAMAQKRQDLLKPLYKEVREAIFKVARAKGFDYVLDSTTGTGIIMADGYDLTPDVKAELGIN